MPETDNGKIFLQIGRIYYPQTSMESLSSTVSIENGSLSANLNKPQTIVTEGSHVGLLYKYYDRFSNTTTIKKFFGGYANVNLEETGMKRRISISATSYANKLSNGSLVIPVFDSVNEISFAAAIDFLVNIAQAPYSSMANQMFDTLYHSSNATLKRVVFDNQVTLLDAIKQTIALFNGEWVFRVKLDNFIDLNTLLDGDTGAIATLEFFLASANLPANLDNILVDFGDVSCVENDRKIFNPKISLNERLPTRVEVASSKHLLLVKRLQNQDPQVVDLINLETVNSYNIPFNAPDISGKPLLKNTNKLKQIKIKSRLETFNIAKEKIQDKYDPQVGVPSGFFASIVIDENERYPRFSQPIKDFLPNLASLTDTDFITVEYTEQVNYAYGMAIDSNEETRRAAIGAPFNGIELLSIEDTTLVADDIDLNTGNALAEAKAQAILDSRPPRISSVTGNTYQFVDLLEQITVLSTQYSITNEKFRINSISFNSPKKSKDKSIKNAQIFFGLNAGYEKPISITQAIIDISKDLSSPFKDKGVIVDGMGNGDGCYDSFIHFAGNGILGNDGNTGNKFSAKVAPLEDLIIDSNEDVFFESYETVGDPPQLNISLRKIKSSDSTIDILYNGLYDGDLPQFSNSMEFLDETFILINLGIDTVNRVVSKINKTTGDYTVLYRIGGAGEPDGAITLPAFPDPSQIGGGGSVFAVDPIDGSIVFAESTNDPCSGSRSDVRLRRISSGLSELFTVAGTGTDGYSGDGGSALDADINILADAGNIAIDSLGNIYFTSAGTFVDTIRRIDYNTGIITTVIGHPTNNNTDSADTIADATTARVSVGYKMRFDSDNNMFFPDFVNKNTGDFTACRIRMWNKDTGELTTVAGNGTSFGNAPENTDPLTTGIRVTGMGMILKNIYFGNLGNDSNNGNFIVKMEC